MISIVTVVYNGVKTLERTINSVLNQDYNNYEYIIIDGGSTDGTIDIIKKYSDKIDYWISEPDSGLYYAMNKGLKKCNGDIIGILNADDQYLPGCFSLVVDSFNKKMDSEVIYGNMIYDMPNRVKMISKSKSQVTEKDFYCMPISHPTVFIKKECYLKYGYFNTNYKIIADLELIYRFVANNVSMSYINKTFVHMKSGGISDYRIREAMKEHEEFLKKYNYVSIYTYFRFKIRKSRIAVLGLAQKNYLLKFLLKGYHLFIDSIRMRGV